MIISDEYTLSYYPNENRIVLTIPQTIITATNTITPLRVRRTDIKEIDLYYLLTMTKIIFNNAQKQGVDDG